MRRVKAFKAVVLIRLLIGIVPYASAQNLVPNPGFEDVEYCQSGSTYKAAQWFNPNFGSPDLYRDTGAFGACFENCAGFVITNIYNTPYGYQLPRSGRVYFGIVLMGGIGSDQREYISVQLSDSLIAGKKYCVSFYTSLSNGSGYASDAVGVCLSQNAYNDCSGAVLFSCSSEVRNPTGNVLTDTLNWILVSDTFVANGGEKFLTIGNFHPDSSSNLQPTGQIQNMCYHYIDDVSVMFCDTFAPTYPNITLFPNPSNGEFTISGNFPEGTQLFVYDMLGQEVLASPYLPIGNNAVPVALHLAQGVYYYELRATEILAEGKLLIIE
jgi:OOP family OmpA-OmpF porin